MKVYCVFSLESPHRGNSNEYSQYTIFNIKKNQPKFSQICSYGIFSKGLKNEFETSTVNEPSVFEPLKVYFIVKAKAKAKDIIRLTDRRCSRRGSWGPSLRQSCL